MTDETPKDPAAKPKPRKRTQFGKRSQYPKKTTLEQSAKALDFYKKMAGK